MFSFLFFKKKVIDTDPSGGVAALLNDDSVKKFEISDSKYSERTDSVRSEKRRRQQQQQTPQSPSPTADDHTPHLHIGERVNVTLLSGEKLQGSVAFIGETDFSKGIWVGAILDEPKGKNDGSVQGKKYFSCKPSHGVFVKPSSVQSLASVQEL